MEVNQINKVYIWLDSTHFAPMLKGYTVCACHSVNEAKEEIEFYERLGSTEFTIDINNDLGNYSADGGDGINLIVWLIETQRNNSNYKVKLHVVNPTISQKMQAFIDKYWEN